MARCGAATADFGFMGEGDEKKAQPSGVDDCESPFDQPVVLPVEDYIDLHPFRPKDIASVVEEYIDQCARAGLRQLRIIHGKGVGVQRNAVRSVLNKHPAVLSYKDAPAEAGAWGATVVILKQES
jgi:dsDNA-specific endonuclease/ATPase MutS2